MPSATKLFMLYDRQKQDFCSCLSQKMKSLKDFWKTYYATCRTRQRVPSTLTKDGVTASNTVEQADMLNRHFVSCYTTDSVETDALPAAATDTPSLSSVDYSSLDVLREFATMKSNVTYGPDGLQLLC